MQIRYNSVDFNLACYFRNFDFNITLYIENDSFLKSSLYYILTFIDNILYLIKMLCTLNLTLDLFKEKSILFIEKILILNAIIVNLCYKTFKFN